MMISTIYFWKNKQLHTYQGDNNAESIREKTKFTNCYAVDSANASANMRYGKYTKYGWETVPLEDFPKAFRTTLLLLGIT